MKTSLAQCCNKLWTFKSFLALCFIEGTAHVKLPLWGKKNGKNLKKTTQEIKHWGYSQSSTLAQCRDLAELWCDNPRLCCRTAHGLPAQVSCGAGERWCDSWVTGVKELWPPPRRHTGTNSETGISNEGLRRFMFCIGREKVRKTTSSLTAFGGLPDFLGYTYS